MTRWWWLRHAPTRDLPAGAIAPWDAPADLTRLPLHPLPTGAHWISSPQPRALATARALAPPGTAIALDPRLAEQNFGAWSGCRHDDLWQSGDLAYRAFWQDPCAGRPPFGESLQELHARVGLFLAQARTAGDIVAIAHVGSIQAALAVALDLPPHLAWRFAIRAGSLTRIDRLAQGWRVAGVNQGGFGDD